MVALSKLDPQLAALTCHELAHPWSKNCFMASAKLFFASSVGSAGFFFILYFCEYLSKALKKKKKPTLEEFVKVNMRSTLFGAMISTVTLSSSCLIRRFLGKYHYISILLIPATIGGFSILIVTRKSCEMFTNAFANCAIEFLITQLQYHKILKWNSRHQTIVFMILSSLLSSLLSRVHCDQQIFWFYMPPKVDEKCERNGCFHKEDCQKLNFNLFFKYSITGYVLQTVKSFLKNINNPNLFFSSLLSLKSFRLAALLGGYVAIYQAVRCFLYQKEKKYSPMHDTLAGFLAGFAFRFQPTLSVFNTAVITLIQIFTEMACKRKILPSLPYMEMVFALTCGLLFHARIFISDRCPKLLIYFMSAITNKKSDFSSQHYKKLLKELNL